MRWVGLYMSSHTSHWARCVWIYLRKFSPAFSKELVDEEEWVSWRYYVDRLYHLGFQGICSFIVLIDSFAFKEEQIAAAARNVSWMEWLAKAKTMPGLSKIHRYCKGPVAWNEFEVAFDGQGSPQEDADLRAKFWHEFWQPESCNSELVWPVEADLAP